MSQKFTLQASTSTQDLMSSNLTPFSNIPNVANGSVVQTSTGVCFFTVQDGTNLNWYIYWTADHSTTNQLAEISTTSSNNVSEIHLTVDSNDNLFVTWAESAPGSPLSYALFVQFFANAGNNTWNAAPAVNFANPSWTASVSSPSAQISAFWTTAGSANGTFVVFFQPDQSVQTTVNVYYGDAGHIITGSGWTYNTTTLQPSGGTAYFLTCSQAKLFNSQGMLAVMAGSPTSATISLVPFSVSGTGAFTFGTALTTISAGASGVGAYKCFLLNYAVSYWALVYPGTQATPQYMVSVVTATSVGSPVASGSPTNLALPLGYNWSAFIDPSVTNQIWVISQGSSSAQLYRLNCTLGGGSPSWSAGATADDTLSPWYAVGPWGADVRAVTYPRSSYIDWQVFAETSSGTYALLGDYTALSGAPAAPTLIAPANSAYITDTNGIVFTAQYNSTDNAYQNAYAMGLEISGASTWSFWNGTTLQSSSYATLPYSGSPPTWGTVPTISVSTAPNAQWSWTVPQSIFTAGNTYVWSAASQESLANLEGPWPGTAWNFTVNTNPAVTVTAPTGTINTTVPFVQWTATFSGTAVQQSYQIYVYPQTVSPGNPGGITPGTTAGWVWNSGVVTTPNTTDFVNQTNYVQVGTPLTNGLAYYVYVQVVDTTSLASTWAYNSFTVTALVPAQPTLTVIATNDSNGINAHQITIQGHDNLLSASDSDYETTTSATWAAAAHTAVSQGNNFSLVGSYCLLLTNNSGSTNTIGANTTTGVGPYPVVGSTTYAVLASARAVTTGRAVTLSVNWYTSNGTFISSSTVQTANDVTGSWTGLSGTVASPANAAYVAMVLSVAGTAATEAHGFDEMGIFPASSVPSWTVGGFVGSQFAYLQFSSDGVTWVYPNTSPYSGLPTYVFVNGQCQLPAPSQQLQFFDYSGTSGVGWYYRVYIQVTV